MDVLTRLSMGESTTSGQQAKLCVPIDWRSACAAKQKLCNKRETSTRLQPFARGNHAPVPHEDSLPTEKTAVSNAVENLNAPAGKCVIDCGGIGSVTTTATLGLPCRTRNHEQTRDVDYYQKKLHRQGESHENITTHVMLPS